MPGALRKLDQAINDYCRVVSFIHKKEELHEFKIEFKDWVILFTSKIFYGNTCVSVTIFPQFESYIGPKYTPVYSMELKLDDLIDKHFRIEMMWKELEIPILLYHEDNKVNYLNHCQKLMKKEMSLTLKDIYNIAGKIELGIVGMV